MTWTCVGCCTLAVCPSVRGRHVRPTVGGRRIPEYSEPWDDRSGGACCCRGGPPSIPVSRTLEGSGGKVRVDVGRLLGPRGGPYAEDPMAELIAHINREVMHHGAEICLLRDLYRAAGVKTHDSRLIPSADASAKGTTLLAPTAEVWPRPTWGGPGRGGPPTAVDAEENPCERT